MRVRKIASNHKSPSTSPNRWALPACLAALVLTGGCGSSELDITVFKDVSAGSGLDAYRGMTHGAAWGDFDGDGLPDVYLTNHLNDAQLFRNLGNGRFSDVSLDAFGKDDLGGDKHGAAWADVDNDGRPDLVQLTGAIKGVGSEPKRLLMNRAGRFEDVAESAGAANIFGRTRMPLWLDLNQDGRLDLFHGAEARFDDLTPPFTFLQTDKGFAEAHNALSFKSRSVPFCIATGLNDDARPEILCRVAGKGVTAQIFDTAALPAHELDLLPVTAFEDAVTGDFDNDGLIDVFLARKNPPGPLAIGRPAPNELLADVWIARDDASKTKGFSFKSTGDIHVQVVSVSPSDAITRESIHVGEKGNQPDGMKFSLSAAASETAGITPAAAEKPAIHIGRTSADRWQVSVSAALESTAPHSASKYQQIALRITSTAPITELEAPEGAIHAEEAPQRLFMNRVGKLVEESDKRGINNKAISAVNVVAGDFDNDMDLDLFTVGSGDVGKQQNMLLLNKGDAYFDVVKLAGGAAGPTTGVGDSVTTADFDGDGFLDILVANGGSMGRSLGLPSDGGGYQLYRNLGNGNHWLGIDLEGTRSNRDGIGARVQVTAGGVTQTRYQDGGIHHRSQNQSRLHFGLDKNARVDKVRVIWPSGVVQELSAIEVNKVMRITEPHSGT